jgi:hypothetical protein
LESSLNDPKSFWSLVNGRKNITNNDITPGEWYDYFKELFEQFMRPEYASIEMDYNDKGEVCLLLDRPIERNDILLALKKLKVNKTTGMDGIPSEIWKFGNLDDILVILFNAILKHGIPSESKTSIIVPLHKKGDVNNSSNYRGISLLVALSKLYSSILNNRLLGWEKENGFFQ